MNKMKNQTKIQVPENVTYLGELGSLKSLPHNSIFDKGKVGCGGTSVAIESDKPYIIAVPFVSLIENKIEQYPNERYSGKVYGFYGGNSLKRDLVAYLEEVEIPKIMVTYDSLKKLTKWINPDDYYILIDELHLLFTEYSYRHKAVQELLEVYSLYKSYCFMTATPLEDEFILDEIKHLPVVEADWSNTKYVNVQSAKVDGSVKPVVMGLVNDFLLGKYAGNAYFFVNSVEYIKDIVKACNLTDDNTRVVYSKNNRKEVGIKRGSSLDAPKKINFVTATAFEGSDFYDEDGVTFIISDSAEAHTLIDISTKFQQIAGRIRNSKYANTIFHIFKHTRYSELSYNEYLKYVDSIEDQTKRFIKNNEGEDYLAKFKNKDTIFNDLYMRKDGNGIVFDVNKLKMDLYQFKITRNIYSLRVNLHNEYKKHGFEVENFDIDLTYEQLNEMSKGETIGFKDIVEKLESEYAEYKLQTEFETEAYAKYPFLQEAIRVLGFEGIKQSKYKISNIKDKLIVRSDSGMETKIIKALNNRFKPVNGDFYPTSKIKTIFQSIYDVLGIPKTGKGTDIKKYYDVKETRTRIDGKLTRGFIILGRKIIYNNNTKN